MNFEVCFCIYFFLPSLLYFGEGEVMGWKGDGSEGLSLNYGWTDRRRVRVDVNVKGPERGRKGGNFPWQPAD